MSGLLKEDTERPVLCGERGRDNDSGDSRQQLVRCNDNMMTALEGQVLMGQQVVFPGTECALNSNRGRTGRGSYGEKDWYGAGSWGQVG